MLSKTEVNADVAVNWTGWGRHDSHHDDLSSLMTTLRGLIVTQTTNANEDGKDRTIIITVKSADFTKDIQEALNTGWIFDKQGYLVKPGDASNHWCSNWTTIEVNKKFVRIPHFLRRRLDELKQIREMQENAKNLPPFSELNK